MSIKDYFASKKIVEKVDSGISPSADDMKILYGSIKTEQKIRSTIRFIWNFIIGLCSIVAAIFSILAYFK